MVKAKKYPRKKLTIFKKLLTERRSELLKQVTDQNEDIGELRDDQPADPLDMAGNSSSLELMTALGNHERVELGEIDHALIKIEAGTFGICEVCEEKISFKRLKARPVTTLCINCKEEQEVDEEKHQGG